LPLRLKGRPAPPLEVPVEREEILKVFPVRTSVVDDVPTPGPGEKVMRATRTDQDILEAVTSHWVYVSYANLAGVPIGGFEFNTPNRRGEGFELREGESRDAVTVYYIDNAKAMARYGDATIRLPRIDAAGINQADHRDILASGKFIPDSTLAWQYYYEYYVKWYKEENKHYDPAPGEHMPPEEPLSREQMRERVDSYLERVNRQMAVRKEHPLNRDPGVSIDEIRNRVYREHGLEDLGMAEETPGEVPMGEDPVE
jgi:hypothetical protein